MKKKINLDVDDAPMFNESWKIEASPSTVEVKPEAYKPKLVTIGPLYQNLEPSFYNFKALCVKKFMEIHRILLVDDLIQHLNSNLEYELREIYNLNLIGY